MTSDHNHCTLCALTKTQIKINKKQQKMMINQKKVKNLKVTITKKNKLKKTEL